MSGIIKGIKVQARGRLRGTRRGRTWSQTWYKRLAIWQKNQFRIRSKNWSIIEACDHICKNNIQLPLRKFYSQFYAAYIQGVRSILFFFSKNSRKFATSPSPALDCYWLHKNYQPIGVTVHSYYVESSEGLLQRRRRGRGCSELWKKHNFSCEHPVPNETHLLDGK